MTPPAPPFDDGRDPAAPALDADITSLLDEGIDPVPMPPAMQERVKRRLLRRIAADSTPRHVTVASDDDRWQPFASGVQIKVLNEAGGVMSYLLRLAAGASLPQHRHPVDEECVVLEGDIRIGPLHLTAGSFHLGRKDVLHDRLSSDHGAVIFLRGATPELSQLI